MLNAQCSVLCACCALCSVLSALSSMLCAPCPVLRAQCFVLRAQCSAPSAPFSALSAPCAFRRYVFIKTFNDRGEAGASSTPTPRTARLRWPPGFPCHPMDRCARACNPTHIHELRACNHALNDIHEHIRHQQIPRHMCVPCLSLLNTLFNPSRNKV